MSDISVLEGRLAQALDRIRKGLDAQADAGVASDAAQAALAQERAEKSELETRLGALKELQDTQVAALSARVESQNAQLSQLDAELQSLRAANTQLREMNTKLREAVTAGLSPQLHSDAVAAEIAAFATQRSADVAEIDAIIAELKPLIAEASDATS